MSIKGYKVVDPDWSCHMGSRKVIFADHGIYEDTLGVIGLASHGFHFCRRLITCAVKPMVLTMGYKASFH